MDQQQQQQRFPLPNTQPQQVPTDGPQQYSNPQWQQPGQPGRPMHDGQQSFSQHPQGPPIIPSQSTPDLNNLYSQGGNPHEQQQQQQQQGMHPVPQQQVPTLPNQWEAQQFQPQDIPVGMPQPIHGDHPPDWAGPQAAQNPQPNFNPNDPGTEWERKNVFEVNTDPPFTDYDRNAPAPGPNPGPAWDPSHAPSATNHSPFTDFPAPGTQDPQQNQAFREAELANARQRIQTLELEGEQQAIQRALEISAREAPSNADLEEEELRMLHEAQLLSLSNYEADLRRQFEGLEFAGGSNAGRSAYDDEDEDEGEDAYETPMPHQRQDEASFYSPDPSIHDPNFVQQAQHYAALSNLPPSQAASAIHVHPAGPSSREPSYSISSRGPSRGPEPGFMPPSEHPQDWSAPISPSFTPTQGVAVDEAARNRFEEDRRRWERMQQGQRGSAAPSVYSVDSDGRTLRDGSEGRGRGM